MSKSSRAAIFGLGVGAAHRQAWLAEGFEIGYEQTLDSESGNLSDCGVASIATYDDDHGSRAVALLRREFAVMVEKPLCLSLPELHEIAQLTRGQKNTLSCNFPLRFHSAFVKFRENIREVQSIYHIECDYEWGRMERLMGWRGRIPYSVSHGAGSHMMNLAAWLVGSRIETVSAVGGGVPSGGCGKTMVSVTGRFENGVTFRSNLNCSFRGLHRHRVIAWGVDGPVSLFNTATTDKGAAVMDFARSIKNGTEPEITRREVLDTSSACFAIEKALGSGRTERVWHLE